MTNIGKNTSYNIHLEEVSADHLRGITNLPNQNLIIEPTTKAISYAKFYHQRFSNNYTFTTSLFGLYIQL
jgi:hypothetical protein